MSIDNPAFMPSQLQTGQYHALESLVMTVGKYDQSTGNNGSHYVAPSPFVDSGLVCANCYFFEGPRACEVVAGDVDPQAVCKLWIIPEELISEATQRSMLQRRLDLRNRAV